MKKREKKEKREKERRKSDKKEKNKIQKIILAFLFLFALSFFIWQHSTWVGWDFQAYVLNAKYWFNDGNYFEWARPPLVPLLIGLFSLFGLISLKASEYIFIIFVVSLHFFSSLKFAERFKLNKLIFYAISLSPFLLIFGIIEGTELLSLALLQLFLAFINTKKAPLFLGLAFLTRYQNLAFLPLLLFTSTKNLKESLKEFLKSAFIFLLVIFPWFLFNFLATGNLFTSFMDSYALNIKFRKYAYQPFSIKDFIIVANYLLPFFILGLVVKGKETFGKKQESKEKHKKREYLLMLIFFALALFSYAGIPIKLPRYLFTALLPIFYFSTSVFEKKPWLTILILFLSFFPAIAIQLEINKHLIPKEAYLNIINEIGPYISDCALLSNGYIMLNYLDIKTGIHPRKELIKRKLDEGYRILLLKNVAEPDYVKNETFLHQFPILKKGKDYILLGNESLCAPTKKVNQSYLESISEFYKVVYNETFSVSFYELLFTNKSG